MYYIGLLANYILLRESLLPLGAAVGLEILMFRIQQTLIKITDDQHFTTEHIPRTGK